MTENNDKVYSPDGGIAILPKTDTRPIAIVGMGSTGAEITQVQELSKRLKQVGMEHVLLSLEDAKKEGIGEKELRSAQLEPSQADGLTSPNNVFSDVYDSPYPSESDHQNYGIGKKHRGDNNKKESKRKKKGKKTHRKKKK